MLYYLFEWLQKLNFPGAGMFGYTSFRALMAVILALLISSIWGDKFINPVSYTHLRAHET